MDQPWLQHYDKTVPATIGNYPEKTLVDLASGHAGLRPDAPAMIFKGKKITYAETETASNALANALAVDGVRPGDRIALLLPNCPQFVIAALAVWKLGGLIVPLNPIYTERELEEALAATQPQSVIVLTPFYDRIKRCQPHTTIRRVIATNIKEYLPRLVRVLFTLIKEKKEGHRIKLQPGDVMLPDLIASGIGHGIRKPVAKPDDPAVILMSGGTTGTAKGVVSEHRSMVAAGMQLSTWLKESISGEGGALLLPLPLFHTYGCAGALSMAMLAGIPLILVPNPRDIGDLLTTIERDHPTLVCGVPTLFNAMLAHPRVQAGKVDFTSVKACFSGAAALMAETKKRFEEQTSSRIVEGYSLTEATMACCLNPYRGVNKIGSVGMPVSDVKVRIVDAEASSRILGNREVGEIVMTAPQLMSGYWNNPDETAQTIRLDPDGSRWLYTGDLGYLDEDGYVFIVDRIKDLIKTSGFQVWPREVEEVIAAFPPVAEVGVAGLPDDRRGEAVTAWIVLRAGATLDRDMLRGWCKERLAPYKVPTRVEVRTELPKTMVGKVLRRALVAEARAAAETGAA